MTWSPLSSTAWTTACLESVGEWKDSPILMTGRYASRQPGQCSSPSSNLVSCCLLPDSSHGPTPGRRLSRTRAPWNEDGKLAVFALQPSCKSVMEFRGFLNMLEYHNTRDAALAAE